MDLKDIYKAKKRILKYIRQTPLEKSHFLSELCQNNVVLKLENQQLTGSFKIRGALNKMLTLPHKERERGIVAASTGNHAQGVGYAAKMLGIQGQIVVPTYTPIVKREAIQRYNMDMIVHGSDYILSEKKARLIESNEGKTFISAYNDPLIIAGQGTIGVEIVEENPKLTKLLVPVGGGGLISGIGCAVKSIDPDIEIIGVQSEASPVMYESMRKGKIVEMELEESVADGLHGGIEEGSITFDLCKQYVDEIILVKEETILRAIGNLLVKQRQVVEGSGAVGVAALLENPQRFKGENVGVLVSGGNVDHELLRLAFQKV
jgi:threonine dehydratase